MIQGLGGCVGAIGMVPCCPFPNPFKNVDQGSVGLVSRFGQFYKVRQAETIRAVLKPRVVGRSRSCQSQRLLRVDPRRRCVSTFIRKCVGANGGCSDVKIQLTTVPRQTVQTKDNVSVEIDSVICWHVVSPYRAAFGINNVTTALMERSQTTLRQVVGGRVLQSVISDREGLAAEVAEIVSYRWRQLR